MVTQERTQDTEQTIGHGCTVNDLHAKLNQTCVARIIDVTSIDDVIDAVRRAKRDGLAVAIAGGRHAMGGQQFATNAILLNMRTFNHIRHFDLETGLIEVEAGIEWPELMRGYHVLQHNAARQWGIRQKQTGADRLSIGGAVAANIHGRGLTMKPFAQDIIALTLVDANGELHRCSRTENAELFSLVVGGYGLFGVVVTVTMQLIPRHKLERIVDVTTIDDLIRDFDARIADGYTYGDFQFAIANQSDDFLYQGVFSCYRPVEAERPMPPNQIRLDKQDWEKLLYLSHTDKQAAYDYFVNFYLATNGQLYWSDTLQLSIYLDDYHQELDAHLGAIHPATEMITELYVPRAQLPRFMDDVRADFRRHDVDLVYGTIRLIEWDETSFLAWAKQDYACVIFNLHTEHTPDGIDQSKRAFQRLIDIALRYGGSYYLTYHKFASAAQMMAAYPQFGEFLRHKRQYDPEERFQSDWYRHYASLAE